MLDQQQIDRVFDQDLYDVDGERIGSVKQVYADDDSGRPEWLTVSTGLFGTKETFVPLTDADLSGDRLTVPYTKSFIKDAPNLDADGHLSPEEEDQLYAYYNRSDDDRTGRDVSDASTTGLGVSPSGQRAGDDRNRSGRGDVFDDDRATDRTDSGSDDAMTVSEERLQVGTQRREAGRARLRKYVVTENVTQTVPVQREEVRLEREPITDANVGDATSGSEISEAEHEVVLHEERPVVEKETVPVERVRLDTDRVTDQETVNEDVRKERVDVDGDVVDSGVTDRDLTDRDLTDRDLTDRDLTDRDLNDNDVSGTGQGTRDRGNR